jgi:hypothetical protein
MLNQRIENAASQDNTSDEDRDKKQRSMQARDSECPCKRLFYGPTPHERITLAEVAVLKRLLSNEHDPWTRAELERDIAGNMLDVSDALTNLDRAGLINLTEQLVTVSRTARHTAEVVPKAGATGVGSGVCTSGDRDPDGCSATGRFVSWSRGQGRGSIRGLVRTLPPEDIEVRSNPQGRPKTRPIDRTVEPCGRFAKAPYHHQF